MHPLSPSELLDAWERGLEERPTTRAVGLLAAAWPEVSAEALAALSVGERDGRLLALREQTFGSRLSSLAVCAGCGERLEWTLDAADLRVAGSPAPVGELCLQADGYGARFRLPNSVDLTAIAACTEVEAASRMLFERCLLAASREGQEVTAEELPAGVVEAIVKRMAEADPQADATLELHCPACRHHWAAVFDIESFFWSEITTWAQRLLTEVHTLASAYGWRESDVLNLSPWRRQFYVASIGA